MRKYKIDPIKNEKKLSELLEDAVMSGICVDPIDIDNYLDDDLRVDIFHKTGRGLRELFGGGKNVTIHKDDDTVGGEITVSFTDLSLSGKKLDLFLHYICSANEIEFTTFNDGHTEFGLIYTDLKVERGAMYEN